MSSKAAQSISLLKDENVIHDVRPSWSRWSGLIFWGVVTAIIVVGIVLLFWAWLLRQNTRYIVTNQRVIEVTGILSTNTTEYRIADIRQIQTGATWSEKMMGHGNLQFATGAGKTITFNGVPNHQDVADSIREIQREIETR